MADPWQMLEDFLQRLQEQQSTSRQVRALLETIQRDSGADLAYACSILEKGPVEQIGNHTQPSVWCRQLTKKLVALLSDQDAHLLDAGQLSSLPLEPKPCSAALVRLSKSRRVWLVALCFNPERSFRRSNLQMMRLARRLLLQQNRQTQTFTQLKEALFGLVRCLTASLDARDPYTWGHSERVARMAVRMAQEMNLSEPDTHDLYLGGVLHDIGKIGVRDDILRKNGPLTDEERTHVERHTVIGDAILSHVNQLAHLRPCVRSHHERFDGQGYPDGLAGTLIPLPARILAIADSCDAMLSDRPYRKGLAARRIDRIVSEGAGTQWDPDIVEIFLRCSEEIYAIHQRGMGDSVIRAIEQVVNGCDPVLNQSSIADFTMSSHQG